MLGLAVLLPLLGLGLGFCRGERCRHGCAVCPARGRRETCSVWREIPHPPCRMQSSNADCRATEDRTEGLPDAPAPKRCVVGKVLTEPFQKLAGCVERFCCCVLAWGGVVSHVIRRCAHPKPKTGTALIPLVPRAEYVLTACVSVVHSFSFVALQLSLGCCKAPCRPVTACCAVSFQQVTDGVRGQT